MSPAKGSKNLAPAGELAARLAHAERLLRLNEAMVAGLIHDLRTPLMAIKLSAEVAFARSHEDAVQQAASRIRTSSDRMARSFDHLLNLSRIGADVGALDLKPGDLNAVSEAAFAGLRGSDPKAVFDVVRNGSFAGVFDAELLRRSIANIVGTALKHAGGDHKVSIHLDGSHHDRLWIRVSVPGVIPTEMQEAMYVPGPSVAGREVPGLGLGLHEIDGFVRAHGGSVVGRSRAPEGTVFELLLPRDALDPQ